MGNNSVSFQVKPSKLFPFLCESHNRVLGLVTPPSLPGISVLASTSPPRDFGLRQYLSGDTYALNKSN